MKSDKNIYFIDSSALITINRFYPKNIFPDLWEQIEDLFKKKRMFSHQLVYNEIVNDKTPKDEIGKLIARHHSAFYPITNKQGQLAVKILATFPRLIDPRAKKDEADPWIIALVLEKMEDEDIFGDASDFVVVSSESEKSETKIPAVCKHFKVRHLNLFQFYAENGWEFSMKRRS
ncbi:MAG: DUF4411 family protein [Ignavibacteriaceae bacterium]|nr:DUF4411 family protein [Ignavibacteriaceae bacterium]